MDNKELFSYRCQYLVDALTFEERRSMGLDNFYKYVEEHIIPIPKSELVVGQEYPGHCRNASKATWDGKKFHYERYKFGDTFDETINHYEDDNEEGIDVFVPIKEI
jgi:hypothetical protein